VATQVIAFEEFAADVHQDVLCVLDMHHAIAAGGGSEGQPQRGIGNMPVVSGLTVPAPPLPQVKESPQQLPRPKPDIASSSSLPDAMILITADASSSSLDAPSSSLEAPCSSLEEGAV
jgi:hypothetical protein